MRPNNRTHEVFTHLSVFIKCMIPRASARVRMQVQMLTALPYSRGSSRQVLLISFSSRDSKRLRDLPRVTRLMRAEEEVSTGSFRRGTCEQGSGIGPAKGCPYRKPSRCLSLAISLRCKKSYQPGNYSPWTGTWEAGAQGEASFQ